MIRPDLPTPHIAKDLIEAAKYKSDKWPKLAKLLGLINYRCGKAFKLIDENYQTVYVRKNYLIEHIFSDPRIQHSGKVAEAFDNMAKLMTYDKTIWHSVLESFVTYTSEINTKEIANPATNPVEAVVSAMEEYHSQFLYELRQKIENYKFDNNEGALVKVQGLLRTIIHSPAVLMTIDLNSLQAILLTIEEHFEGNDAIQHDLNIVNHLIAESLTKVKHEFVDLLPKLEEYIDVIESSSPKQEISQLEGIRYRQYASNILKKLQVIARYKNFIPLLDFDDLYFQLKRVSSLLNSHPNEIGVLARPIDLVIEEINQSPIISFLLERDFQELVPTLLPTLKKDIDSIASSDPIEDQLTQEQIEDFRVKSEKILQGLQIIAKNKNFLDSLNLNDLCVQLRRVDSLIISHPSEMASARSIDLVLEEIYRSDGLTKLIGKTNQMQKEWLDNLLDDPGFAYENLEPFLKLENQLLALMSRQCSEISKDFPEKAKKMEELAKQAQERCKLVVGKIHRDKIELEKLRKSLKKVGDHVGTFSDQSEYRIIGLALSEILKHRTF